WIAPRIAASTIEMQVRVDHPAHVLGSMSELPQRVLELGPPTLPRVLDSVDVTKLLVSLVADPRIDQDQAVVVLDEETAQRERDAVALIGGDAPLPQRLRHDAEHGSPV